MDDQIQFVDPELRGFDHDFLILSDSENRIGESPPALGQLAVTDLLV
jgi:hypothetical protein